MISRYRLDRSELIALGRQFNPRIPTALAAPFIGAILVRDTYLLYASSGEQLVVPGGKLLFTDFTPNSPFKSPWDSTMESLAETDAIVVYAYPPCTMCASESVSVLYGLENPEKQVPICAACRDRIMQRDAAFIESSIRAYAEECARKTEEDPAVTTVMKVYKLLGGDPERMEHTKATMIAEKTAEYTTAVLNFMSSPFGEDNLPKETPSVILTILKDHMTKWSNDHD